MAIVVGGGGEPPDSQCLVSLWRGNVFNVTRLTGQFSRFTIIIFTTRGSSPLSPHNYFWFSLELKFIDPACLLLGHLGDTQDI